MTWIRTHAGKFINLDAFATIESTSNALWGVYPSGKKETIVDSDKSLDFEGDVKRITSCLPAKELETKTPEQRETEKHEKERNRRIPPKRKMPLGI